MRNPCVGLAALTLLTGLVGAPPALASTLPHADFDQRPIVGFGLGANALGTGQAGISGEVPLGTSGHGGLSVGATTLGSVVYEARGMYRLVDPSGIAPAVVAIAGVWGGTGDPSWPLATPFWGFGISYGFLDRWTMRISLVQSPFHGIGVERFGVLGQPPSTGVELAYRWSPEWELTLGPSGRGDLVGLSWSPPRAPGAVDR